MNQAETTGLLGPNLGSPVKSSVLCWSGQSQNRPGARGQGNTYAGLQAGAAN